VRACPHAGGGGGGGVEQSRRRRIWRAAGAGWTWRQVAGAAWNQHELSAASKSTAAQLDDVEAEDGAEAAAQAA